MVGTSGLLVSLWVAGELAKLAVVAAEPLVEGMESKASTEVVVIAEELAWAVVDKGFAAEISELLVPIGSGGVERELAEPTKVAAESVDEVVEYKVVFIWLTVVAWDPSGTPVEAMVFPGVVR